MRALWLAAPWALTRYAAVFAAVALAAGLAAGAAASSPFVRAGVESSSLRSEVRSMSRYAAGLSIFSQGGTASTDPARRAAGRRFRQRLSFAGAPVLTSRFDAQVQTADSNALTVVVMARTNATGHVVPLSGSGPGAWVSIVAAKGAGIRAGSTLTLTEFSRGTAPLARVHVARIYQALDTNLFDPYWSNLVQDIRSLDPDAPTPPTYVFVDERTLLRLARQLGEPVTNQFEYPVATRHLTYVGATKLQRTFATLVRQVTQPGTSVGRALGCGGITFDGKPTCIASSSVSAALAIAAGDVDALSATIFLLSSCALGIALLVGAAAGVFLVRRRSDEAHLLFARGERTTAFAARTAVEAVLPALLGVGLGVGLAFLALRVAAPAGTLDGSTAWRGVRNAALAGLAVVVLLAATAGAAFPRRADAGHPLLRRAGRIPWEALPLTGAAAVLVVLLTGGGLAHSANGHVHPRLAVFLLPVLAGAGIAGVLARGARRASRLVPESLPVAIFFTSRRIAAARGLLVAVIVAAATSLAVFAYATTLSSSVSRGIAEKSYVANGSDVQGVVDPREQIYDKLPFPAVIVETDASDAFVSDGHPVDLVAGDLASIARVIRWGPWSDDPRRLIPRLERASGPPRVLPVIASPTLPRVSSIVDQGVRIPIDVVGRAPFPGMSPGRPALLMSRTALRQVAAHYRIADPGPGAGALIWARGEPARVEAALRASNIKPAFLTTFSLIRSDPSVRAGKRSYGYLRAVGGGAVVLALLALVLYLQARQRRQVLASALLRRMGLRRLDDVGAVALEALTIVALAFVVGVCVATLAARVVTPHVDPLPQYAPGTPFVLPWPELLVVGGIAGVCAVVAAAFAVWLAARADASEALRVA